MNLQILVRIQVGQLEICIAAFTPSSETWAGNIHPVQALREYRQKMGIGAKLVEECITFSRARGYRRITLWTHKELTAARAIYKKFGFTKTGEESHHDWVGKATSEFWDLDL